MRLAFLLTAALAFPAERRAHAEPIPPPAPASPRFQPFFWRVATSDVVLIGHYEKVAGSEAGTTEWRLYADEVLAGSFVPERAFTFDELGVQQESSRLAAQAGERAVFLLREERRTDDQLTYTVSQGIASKGCFLVEDSLSTFNVGLYELDNQSALPWADFHARLVDTCAKTRCLVELDRRFRERPRGDAEVGFGDLYSALRRVRTEDIAAALEVVDAALASKENDWWRKILEESRQVLLERAKAALEPRK